MTMRAPSSELPIEFDGVTVTAGGVTILDNIALSLLPGAPTVLIGPNGSGKSTLLRVAMGLLAPTRGRITWGGLENVPPLKLRSCFNARRCSAAAPPPISASRCAPPASRARSMRAAPASCSNWSVSVISPIAPREGYPAASSSGWRWRGRSRAIRPRCFSTSRPRVSIRPPPRRWKTSSAL
jgi:energy-coupling factor transporter ATP-binding protein EcfA2